MFSANLWLTLVRSELDYVPRMIGSLVCPLRKLKNLPNFIPASYIVPALLIMNTSPERKVAAVQIDKLTSSRQLAVHQLYSSSAPHQTGSPAIKSEPRF